MQNDEQLKLLSKACYHAQLSEICEREGDRRKAKTHMIIAGLLKKLADSKQKVDSAGTLPTN